MTEAAPVLFKRKSAKHAARSRAVDVDTKSGQIASGTAAGTGDEPPSVIASKLKSKLKSRNKPSKLSFGGEEEEGEGEVFQVKKSSLSKKLALSKQSGHITPSSFEPVLPKTSNGPTYSVADLNALKASTPSARPRQTDESASYDAEVSMAADSLAHSSLSQIVDLTEDVDMETSIPSASAVQAAKEKRERIRKTGPDEEDFISLSVAKRVDFSQGPHPESRLMREEDEVGEGEDEYAEYTSAQERIALGKKSRKLEAKKRREEMHEMIADAEEEDEETMEWEQEQIRRGGMRMEESVVQGPKPTYKPAPIPTLTPIPTLGPAIARLTHSLTALTTSHAEHTTSMVSLSDELSQLEIREKEMREMIVKAEEKRSWFASFREWMESVAAFLDQKFPPLEKLEDEQVSLLQERYDMVDKRRRADDEDDLSLFLGTPPPPLQQAEETDELGRVVPKANPAATRRERMSARISRRDRRRMLSRASATTSAGAEEDGYSTDSSLPPSDAADYETAVESLLEKGQDILSDVRAKEFREPGLGLGKWFGEWRERYADSYTGAWGGLGMVGAWEFWTRLEILGWNPLEDTRSLDTFSWYTSLYEYSRPRNPEQNEDEDILPELGPDGDLVSAMISTAIIPRISKMIESGAFDPYSVKDTRSLVDVAEQIESSVERDNLKFQILLKAPFTVFQRAVAVTETALTPYLALNNPRFDPEAIPARRRYLTRQYKLLSNMLRWRKYAGERFGLGNLITTLLTKCMLPIAESGWDVGGEIIMRKAIEGVPAELVPSMLQARMRTP
ncbi:hypothetical protein NM688_g1824 [Phlebia brevispora]|uniref:Uncharacterized protein n=1 Tax=Phlebia brevispora TaxID=194682 RepID=A0ACC1TAQ4_9APHY|nr:hypothetical protein NM688_g1824 [Phlebia brevispora]